MSKLGHVVEAVVKYNKFVEDEAKRARTDKKFGQQMVNRWNEIKAKIPVGRAPTGLALPRVSSIFSCKIWTMSWPWYRVPWCTQRSYSSCASW